MKKLIIPMLILSSITYSKSLLAEATTLLSSGQIHQSQVSQGDSNYYQIYVKEGQKLAISLDEMNSDGDLYVRTAADRDAEELCSSTKGAGANDSCQFRATSNMMTYIEVRGYQATDYSLRAIITGATESLQNGEAKTSFVQLTGLNIYKMSVKAGQKLTVTLDQLSDDADLYVNIGSTPNVNAFKCKSTNGNDAIDSCEIDVKTSGKAYIGVVGYRRANYSIIAHLDGNNAGNNNDLTSGRAVSGSVNRGQTKHYKIKAQNGEHVKVVLNGLSNDADLYVKINSQASRNSNDCNSTVGGTNEDTCSIDMDNDGYLHIAVYGYRAANYKIKATIEAVAKFPPETTLSEVTAEYIEKPDYLDSYTDPNFNTIVTRISDRENEGIDSTTTHPYPKKGSAWNENSTLLKMGFRIFDSSNNFEEIPLTKNKTNGEAYRLLGSPRRDIRWSATEPNIWYALGTDQTFRTVQLSNDKSSTSIINSHSFKNLGFELIQFGPGEGNLSIDDRYVVFAASKAGSNTVYLILYDIPNETVMWNGNPKTLDKSKAIWTDDNDSDIYFDWVTVSPLGQHIMVNTGEKMYYYDMNLNNEKEIAQSGHGDIGLNKQGTEEIYLQFESKQPKGIVGHNLHTGEAIRYFDSSFGGGHVSCRNYNRKGWCYLSVHRAGKTDRSEVIALRLKLDNQNKTIVQRYAKTRMPYNRHDYSQVGVSPDGVHVLFASSFGNPNTPVDHIDTFHVTVKK